MFSPDSRQVAFLAVFDVEPSLIAQNADGSSTGLFGRERGGLSQEVGMLPPIRWTTRGIVGNAVLGDFEGFGVQLYVPSTNNFPTTIGGLTGRVDVSLIAVSPTGRVAYRARPNRISTLNRAPGIRLNTRASRDRPLRACKGTAEAETIVGTPLNDVIDSRAGNTDTVTCGRGYDTVYADRQDKVGKDCEHIIRN